MKTPETELNYKVGDRITLWDAKETIREEMWLASKGIMTKVISDVTLEVVSVRKDDE